MKAKTTKLIGRFWRWARPIVFMVVVLSAVRSSIADWNDVPTGSMLPTIVPGDRIFVNKLAYDLKVPFTDWRLAQWSTPAAGEIVVFFSPADERRLVKRVVAVAGDTVELRDNRLVVNGRQAEYEPAALDATLPDEAHRPRRQLTEAGPAGMHPVILTSGLGSRRSFDAFVVPQGHCFVMGDNRDLSADSRYFGPVECSRIVGRATTVVISLDRDSYYMPRLQRLLRPLE